MLFSFKYSEVANCMVWLTESPTNVLNTYNSFNAKEDSLLIDSYQSDGSVGAILIEFFII